MVDFLFPSESCLIEVCCSGVTEDSLNLQLLGGKLKLENLSIKETALAWLELPFRTSGMRDLLNSVHCSFYLNNLMMVKQARWDI